MARITAPYAAHRRRMETADAARIADSEPLTSAHGGTPVAVAERAVATVAAHASGLVELSRAIHEHPELCFEEHFAAGTVARLLETAGHDVESGAYGLPTALRCRAGTDRPRVAVIAEYDALPGIGHACGHNVICAAAVGAFLTIAEVVADLGGSVELIGAPAEEGGGGKQFIIDAGGFAEIDAAMMVHPAAVDAADHPMLGFRQVLATYQGLAAHASASPHLGRNALDAAVLSYQGVAGLRQHILPTDRVHGIITDGGQAPNVIPERAAAHFFVRSLETDTLAELCARVQAILEGAALSTGTALDARWDPSPPYLPTRGNPSLAARYAVNLAARGRKVLGPGRTPDNLTASTDMGNVSQLVPSIHPFLAIAPLGVELHTPSFARWAASDTADCAVLDGAVGLALTAADYLADEALRVATADEFDRAGGVVPAASLIG